VLHHNGGKRRDAKKKEAIKQILFFSKKNLRMGP
jgi:hypothetical protein